LSLNLALHSKKASTLIAPNATTVNANTRLAATVHDDALVTRIPIAPSTAAHTANAKRLRI